MVWVNVLYVKVRGHNKHWKHATKLDFERYKLGVFSPFFSLSLFFRRSYRVEHGERPEVAAVDWTSVQAAARRKGLPRPDRKGPVRHERGGVSPALAAVWRHAARTPGHMEVRCVFQQAHQSHLQLLWWCVFMCNMIWSGWTGQVISHYVTHLTGLSQFMQHTTCSKLGFGRGNNHAETNEQKHCQRKKFKPWINLK